jgi:hypothetical protein
MLTGSHPTFSVLLDDLLVARLLLLEVLLFRVLIFLLEVL